MSITPNYPCLIASVEPDRSWEGFSATEKILRLLVGGGVLDGEQSCGAVVDGRVWETMGWGWDFGGLGGLLPLNRPSLSCPTHKMNQHQWASSQTAVWQQHGWEETPVKQKRGEEEESHSVATTVGMLKTVLSWGLGNPTPELEPVGMENGACLPWERRCQMENNITWSLDVGELAVTHFLCCVSDVGGVFDRTSK